MIKKLLAAALMIMLTLVLLLSIIAPAMAQQNGISSGWYAGCTDWE